MGEGEGKGKDMKEGVRKEGGEQSYSQVVQLVAKQHWTKPRLTSTCLNVTNFSKKKFLCTMDGCVCVGEEGGSGRGEKEGRGEDGGEKAKGGRMVRKREEREKGGGKERRRKRVEHNKKIVVWGVPAFQTTVGGVVSISFEPRFSILD